MPSLTIPYVFTAETVADATQINADFQAIVAKFTGGIVDADIALGADIDGNKLSTTSGKQIPTLAIGPGQVTDAKLAFDAINPGNDALRAVSGDHIKLLTGTSLARFLPLAKIAKDKLAILSQTVAFGPGAMPIASVEVRPLTPIPTATNLLLGIYFQTLTGGTATSFSLQALQSTTIPTGGGYTLGTSYYSSSILAGGAGNLSGSVVFVYIATVTS